MAERLEYNGPLTAEQIEKIDILLDCDDGDVIMQGYHLAGALDPLIGEMVSALSRRRAHEHALRQAYLKADARWGPYIAWRRAHGRANRHLRRLSRIVDGARHVKGRA